MTKKKKKPNPPPPAVRRASRQPVAAPAGAPRPARPRPAKRPQQRRAGVRQRLGTAGLVLTVLAGIGVYVLLDRRSDAELRSALTQGTCSVDSRSDPTAGPGLNHVPAPRFQVNPPAGGNHLASAARGGVFSAASAPQDGLLVHSLEHGYIVVWHAPDLPAAQKIELESFESDNDGDVIVVERAGMPTTVAATAWNQRLLCEAVEPAALDRFFAEYVGKGPEKVPRG